MTRTDDDTDRGAELAQEADPFESGQDDEAADLAASAAGQAAQAERCVLIAKEICALMRIEVAHIRSELLADEVIVHLEGVSVDLSAVDERAFESMQFLINKATQRHGARRSRVTLRVDGVRGRRRDSVDGIIQWLQQRVQASGRVFTVGPMEPADLRAFTSALHRAGSPQQQVVGAGDLRKLALRPEGVDADGNAQRARRRRRRRRN